MNELAINLSPDFVDDRYFEVLIVPQAKAHWGGAIGECAGGQSAR